MVVGLKSTHGVIGMMTVMMIVIMIRKPIRVESNQKDKLKLSVKSAQPPSHQQLLPQPLTKRHLDKWGCGARNFVPLRDQVAFISMYTLSCLKCM